MKRLDQLVSLKFNISRTLASDLIKNGKVLVESIPILSSSKKFSDNANIDVSKSDLILKEKSSEIFPENIDLDILYEDDNVLVINKNPGISVHTSIQETNGTLTNALLFKYPNLKDKFKDDNRFGIVHRIDKETTGVLIIAKNFPTKEYLSKQFADRSVYKEYMAVVEGIIDVNLTIEKPIARNKKDRKKMGIDPAGRSALTNIVPISIYEDDLKNKYTLVKVIPKTGRTHQIRVHLKSIGHPVIGDRIYNGKENDHMLLHAKLLKIDIPKVGEKIFEAPIPDYFNNFLNSIFKIKEI